MTKEGWGDAIRKAVDQSNAGDFDALELLASLLEEVGIAKQELRDKGYGCIGMGILATIQQEVPAVPIPPVVKLPLPKDGVYPSWCRHDVGVPIEDGLNCALCGYFVPNTLREPLERHTVRGVVIERWV